MAARRKEDPRYLEIDGRRWRRSDPAIPETLRTELVHELMAARRAVGAAKRAADPDAERLARARVHAAKLALGERGRPHWEPPEEAALRKRAVATMHALLAARGPSKTICPSDVARVVGGSTWRGRMAWVRALAVELASRGELRVLQRGLAVDPAQARGPIRLAAP